MHKDMKTLKVPFVEGLEGLSFESLDLLMEEKAAKAYIDNVCWPAEFPYAPTASVRIARSGSHLVIVYNVRGLDLRGVAMLDNEAVWQDSCCEFFVADPSDGTYYNFEMNCVGTILAAKRQSRTEFTHFGEDVMSRLIRHTTLERRAIDKAGLFDWSMALYIPMDIIGLNPEALPASIRANFYKCGDATAHPHYLSWNRVETETPDFHRPEFFGELTL